MMCLCACVLICPCVKPTCVHSFIVLYVGHQMLCVHLLGCYMCGYTCASLSLQHFSVCVWHASSPTWPSDRTLSDYKGTLLALILMPLHFIQDVCLPLRWDCTHDLNGVCVCVFDRRCVFECGCVCVYVQSDSCVFARVSGINAAVRKE